jgi:hypothetical protein
VDSVDHERAAPAADIGQSVDPRQDLSSSRCRDRGVFDEAILHVYVEECGFAGIEFEVGHGTCASLTDAPPTCQAQ